MKRSKRLKKGIKSLDEEISLHQKKMEAAKEAGNIGLVGYYDKELTNLMNQRDRKKKVLEK